MLLDIIAKDTGLTRLRVLMIARTANHSYKTYSIPKRNGRGERQIAHPSRELKVLQAWLAVRVFAYLPVHDSVFSYRHGRGIRQNANAHRDNNYLLRLDIRDFFPSISGADIRRLLLRHQSVLPIQLSNEEVDFVATLVVRNGGLPIGAPSSPPLSNSILFPIDQLWADYAARESLAYTRYADDLYFSTNRPNLLAQLPANVARTLQDLPWPTLRLNHQKSVFTSRKRQRCVTGLILTSTNQISLGHQKKRAIRSMVHRCLMGRLAEQDWAYLRGYLAYANGVEPSFLTALSRKFGEVSIQFVMRGPANHF